MDKEHDSILNDAIADNDASLHGTPNWISDSNYWGDYYLDFSGGDYAELNEIDNIKRY